MPAKSSQSLPNPPSYGTGLVDRMNIFMHVLRAGRFIIRRWWIFLICLSLTGGFAVYKALSTPNQYRAVAELAPPLSTLDNSALIVEQFNADREVQIIYSQDIVNSLRAKWADYRSPDGTNPVASMRMTHQFGGSASFKFDLQITSTDEDFSEKVVQDWAQMIMDKKRENALKYKQRILDNKTDTLDELEAKRESVRTEIDSFLRNNPDFDLNGDDTFKRLQTDRQELQTALDEIEWQLDMIRGTDNGNPFLTFLDKYGSGTSGVINTQGSDGGTSDLVFTRNQIQDALSLRNQLEEKTADRQRYSLDLKDRHPFMQELNAEIAGLQRSFDQMATLFNGQIKGKESSLRRQKDLYVSRIAAKQLEIESLGPKQKAYNDLVMKQRDIEASIKDKMDEFNKDREGGLSLNLEILQDGRSIGKIGPNRPFIIAAGVIAGFILAGVTVFFLSKLDDRLELAEDFERELQEHVLGQIPKVSTPPAGKNRFLITDLGLHDMFCESLRGVRSAFKYYTKGQSQIRSLLITSAVPGDGKSTVTVNFSATLAMSGSRVLLIDADLRRGSVNEFFEFKRSGGLSDVLSGKVHWLDVTRESLIPNLEVITTGKLPLNPGELLSSPVLPVMIKQALEEYDYVIIDCPPLTAIDDTFSVFEHVDTGLFVVRAGQTSLRFIKNSLHELDKRGQQILGLVLNGITTADPSYYYAKYYHSYYNKDLPNSAVETSSVYQPASAMPEPKRRQFRNVNQSAAGQAPHPRHAGDAGGSGENSGQETQNQGKTVRYKARRAYRVRKDGGQQTSGVGSGKNNS